MSHNLWTTNTLVAFWTAFLIFLVPDPASAQDDFQNKLNQILRNPSTDVQNLGQQGVILTNECYAGNMRACSAMENYGQQWCTGKGDCTYLVRLYQQMCSLGNPVACETANNMQERAFERWEKYWGKKR